MKTLGLLEVDQLDDDLRERYGSYGRMFAHFFDRLGASLTYRYYQVQQGTLPRRPEECDAYLITGSRAGVYDDLPWLPLLRDWIIAFNRHKARLIGVCFGHQMLAHSLGGYAAKSEKGWGVGIKTAQFLSADGRHTPAVRFRLLYSHQDQVQSLPAGGRILAGNDFCPIAAFALEQHVLGFQGHPEFTIDYLEQLLLRRREQIGPACYRDALTSLTQATDEVMIGRKIVAFIDGVADF